MWASSNFTPPTPPLSPHSPLPLFLQDSSGSTALRCAAAAKGAPAAEVLQALLQAGALPNAILVRAPPPTLVVLSSLSPTSSLALARRWLT